ncbi:hypothetical protein [Limnoglobus roseus]|uniref:Glycosyltransferase n=1 Tax=Limnoglobus roseus TaxID=2598579 RepID=A0A5C1AB93_9BACT|nr:hypothetical protein [Limnoglobus roseus]QEL14404.1 hypothetical protein PX52LOC_01292 [Limnoglobus roseus]
MPSTPPAISAAPKYDRADGLTLLTTYFNSHGYRTKRQNYDHFRERIEVSGLNLVTIECAFGDAAFELPPSPNVWQVRARDLMWQKERLLNAAVARLPRECRKVAWLDGDILFERPDWAAEAVRLLDEFPVVQLFDRAVRLPRDHASYTGEGDIWESFAAVYRKRPHQLLKGDFAAHGHTGFAWAARREWLDAHGLYDACIAGSGDHMMAHALCGDWTSPCVQRIIGSNNRHREFFAAWAKRQYRDVRAKLGCVPGTVLHLWHGETADRRYVLRNQELAAFGFDPAADVRIGPAGCWEWSSRKPALHRWASDYFGHRREDGL